MRTFIALLATTAAGAALSGCGESRAHEHDHAADATPAASYRAGYGVQLTPAGRQFSGLQTESVSAATIDGDAVVAVPAAAVLRTVRGDFAYVSNGDWFLRTPVKTGRADGARVEITEGLYEGDTVVTGGLRALALAEMQAVNGGVGCADGH